MNDIINELEDAIVNLDSIHHNLDALSDSQCRIHPSALFFLGKALEKTVTQLDKISKQIMEGAKQ
ncbi:MAG: hypothetical protein E7562_05530 [Ruminococcaceae bacterium]|nr:hypothetical protein [Oscillospiraceae bacterium]